MEEAEDTLVHAEHDGCAGHGAHEMGCQAAIETHEALLDPDELEALHQAGVLGEAVIHGRLS